MAAQVRNLVSGSGDGRPVARTTPIPPEPATGQLDVDSDGPTRWLPGHDFEQQVPRRPLDPDEPGPRPQVRAGGLTLPPRLRWNPGRRGAAALGLLVIVVVACLGWWLASARPTELPVSTAGTRPAQVPPTQVPSGTPSSGTPATPAGPSTSALPGTVTSSAAALIVDVAGKVRRPGIYLLPPGSRVYDAVRAAGGVRPGVSTVSLNLAAPVHDGEQIVVGVAGIAGAPPGDPSPGTDAGAGGGTAPASIVDVNTATLEQLETLPGVGPVLGQHILDYRTSHGPFASIDQLQDVSGIGPAKYAALKSAVTV